MKMSHGSPKKWMEGSDYEDKWGQQANDMGRMSNHVKREDKFEKRIGVNRNSSDCIQIWTKAEMEEK